MNEEVGMVGLGLARVKAEGTPKHPGDMINQFCGFADCETCSYHWAKQLKAYNEYWKIVEPIPDK